MENFTKIESAVVKRWETRRTLYKLASMVLAGGAMTSVIIGLIDGMGDLNEAPPESRVGALVFSVASAFAVYKASEMRNKVMNLEIEAKDIFAVPLEE